MKTLWKYVRQQKKFLIGALLLATINQVFSLLDPQIFRLIVDNYASRVSELSRAEFFQGILLLLLASMGVAFVSRVAKNFQDYYLSIVTQRVGAEMYENSVRHAMSLPYMAFEDQRSGELLQTLQKARTDTQALITTAVGLLFFSLVGIIFVVVYALTVNWIVGVVYLAIIPLMGTVTFFLTRRIKNAQKEIVQETAMMAGSTTETLRNVELVKSLGLESQEAQRLNDTNAKILDLELKKIRLIRVLSFTQGTIVNAIRSALLLLMMWLIFERDITFGQFFSLYIYSFFIFGPLGELGSLANVYQEARASMERLERIMSQKPEEKPMNPVIVDELQTIEFDGVQFGYDSNTRPAVDGASFTLKKGETIALVGPSGSGKSTALKLIVGLYRPTAGTIRINGEEGSRVDYDAFRRRIGYVSQDTQLFAGTIRENLLFVRPEASDAQCMLALEHAAALPIVERGGKGLDTRIGEGGLKLSGGERQRLAIARALLREPNLIIFDEATSSLDSITEKEITHTIKQLEEKHPGMMSVLVAHRLSTIAHADRIYVLEKGKISESGKHQDLLGAGGLYAALWREQQATFEA
jgi:ATP-binding cassette, subfamily B, bacterial